MVGSLAGIFRLNLTDGEILWNVKGIPIVMSSPAIVGNHVFIGTDGGEILSIDGTTGEIVGRLPTKGIIESSPTVQDGMLFVGSRDGLVYGVSVFARVAESEAPGFLVQAAVFAVLVALAGHRSVRRCQK